MSAGNQMAQSRLEAIQQNHNIIFPLAHKYFNE